MSAATSLIESLSGRGVEITRRGDRLRIVAPHGAVTPEIRQALAAQKPALLAVLPDTESESHHAATGSPGSDQSAPAEDETRERGKRLANETVPAMCQSCGPIWLSPEIAAAAPVVAGWPRVIGCPWCHVKNRRALPRPVVACIDCERFERDRVNPAGGMGRCPIDLAKRPLPFPHARRECRGFAPSSQKE